jgi:hypothetical protein
MARAQTAKATGNAFDATVRITDYASASIGTSLGPRLLEEAANAASLSAAAAASGDPEQRNAELQSCLVAILCAHAAVEAQMNEVGEVTDRIWWATKERMKVERKWVALAERRTGTKPPRSDPPRKAVRLLTIDRNLVAHFRGLKQRDGSYKVPGPPVTAKGGISPVRAYFDAARAQRAVADAEEAFKAL